MSVTSGVQANEATIDRDGITNAELAVIHEFGTTNNPERSFIRAPFDANVKSYDKLLKSGVKAITAGRASKEKVLGVIGLKMVSDSVDAINDGIAPANKPATVKAKGSSTPLIDKGPLKQAITFVVKK